MARFIELTPCNFVNCDLVYDIKIQEIDVNTWLVVVAGAQIGDAYPSKEAACQAARDLAVRIERCRD